MITLPRTKHSQSHKVTNPCAADERVPPRRRGASIVQANSTPAQTIRVELSHFKTIPGSFFSYQGWLNRIATCVLGYSAFSESAICKWNGLTPAAKERPSGMFWQGFEREMRDRLSWAAVYSSKPARGVAGALSAPIAPIRVYTRWICKTSLKSRLPMQKSWNIGCHLFRTRAGLERTKSI